MGQNKTKNKKQDKEKYQHKAKQNKCMEIWDKQNKTKAK